MFLYPMIKLHTRLLCNLDATRWHIEIEEAFSVIISNIFLILLFGSLLQ